MTRSPARSTLPAPLRGDHTTTDVCTSEAVLTSAGTRIPATELRARRVAREAGRWRTFAAERTRMRPSTLDVKVLDACAFSVHHGASSFAVPSKLVGTSRHQPLLRSLSLDPSSSWLALDLGARGDDLVVSRGGRVLGRVQPKHLGWVRPLIPFGLTVHLARVTGTDASGGGSGYRLGCNVAFGHVGEALGRLDETLAGPGGDGAGGGALRLVVSNGAPGPPQDRIGIPVRPEYEAITGDAEDVVLWRTAEGVARASVPHAARHSPTGIEWGYGGSGPADLALSVLLVLVGERAAGALYQQFKHEVVAHVPEEGGVLPAEDVRAWVARSGRARLSADAAADRAEKTGPAY